MRVAVVEPRPAMAGKRWQGDHLRLFAAVECDCDAMLLFWQMEQHDDAIRMWLMPILIAKIAAVEPHPVHIAFAE